MSESDAAQLRKHYADLDDAALVGLLLKQGLTDSAREIAMAELASRGIALNNPHRENEAEHINADTDGLDSLSIIASFNSPTEAHMLEFRLQAEGIPAWTTNAETSQALSYMTLAMGGVKVMVPTHLVGEAKEVIRALEAGEYALDDDYEETD